MKARLLPYAAALAVLLLAAAPAARAQGTVYTPEFDPDPFVITSDPASVALTEGARPLDAGTLAVGLALRLGGPPLHACVRSGGGSECDVEGDIVSTRFASDLTAAFGFGRIEAHAQLPIILHQGSDFDPPAGGEPLGAFGIGDLRLGGKLRLVRAGSVALGWNLAVSLPTGGGDNFIGNRGTVVENRALVDWRGGRLALAANLGYAWHQRSAEVADLYVNDELVWSAGAEYAITPDKLTAGASLFGRIGVVSPEMATEGGLSGEERPMEARLSARYWLSPSLAVETGAGAGLGSGYGAPSFRALAGLRWVRRKPAAPEPPPPLPPDPEPKPQPKPAPPPPPPPPVDTDGDDLFDPDDRCVDKPEDKDGFEDDDGCPDDDNDSDGVVDASDRCRDEAGPIENVGCPDTDRDSDTVVDRLDNCPDEPGSPDNHGCKKKQLVVMAAGSIQLLDTIHFELNKARIRSKSHKLLDNIAAVIKAHSEIKRIEVIGHTDSIADDSFNMQLSEKRAAAVVAYLAKKGVESDRMVALGKGESEPIADNGNDAGRARNRRVEFKIVDPAPGAPAPAPATAPTAPAPMDD